MLKKGDPIFIAPFDDWAIVEKVENGMVTTQSGNTYPILQCRLDKGKPFHKPSEMDLDPETLDIIVPDENLENQMVLNNE